MSYIRNLMRKAHRDEEGITGLETAIILIAFVVVATVFAFVVLTTGIFSAERGKETVFAGLQKARGTMEVRGGIVVNASTITAATAGPPPTPQEMTAGTVQFTVANTAGGDSIPLDWAATTNKTVIAYRDAEVIAHDVEYSVVFYGDDGDTLLEPGEQAVITIDIDDITTAITNGGTLEINPNDRWTLELETPVGAVIDLTRSFPAQLDAVMQLH